MTKIIKKYIRRTKSERLKGYNDFMEHFLIIKMVMEEHKTPLIQGNSQFKTQIKIINQVLEFLNIESEKIWTEIDPGGSDKLKEIKEKVHSSAMEIKETPEHEIKRVPLTSNN